MSTDEDFTGKVASMDSEEDVAPLIGVGTFKDDEQGHQQVSPAAFKLSPVEISMTNPRKVSKSPLQVLGTQPKAVAGVFLLWVSIIAIIFAACPLILGLVSQRRPATYSYSLELSCPFIFNQSGEQLIETVNQSDSLCHESVSDCRCENTVMPKRPGRGEDFDKLWNKTTERNQAWAAERASKTESNYDVVFYGDSITEHWGGTDLADSYPAWEQIHEVFNASFNRQAGGLIDGLPLGIGGDRCGQVLYRLDNGELPDTLNAKVFWILIGTNDLGGEHCSAESIAAGNFRIAEEILARRPHAKVVLNSVLPRGDLGESYYENWQYNEMRLLNQWLECYAESRERVEFFNATSIFVEGDKAIFVEDFYADPVHPSASGSFYWAYAIVRKVIEMTGGTYEGM